MKLTTILAVVAKHDENYIYQALHDDHDKNFILADWNKLPSYIEDHYPSEEAVN